MRLKLSAALDERRRVIGEREVNAGGAYVLYWVHHAMRDHENPALDVAVSVANGLNVPVLVYQELGSQYPYASDRHFNFILEGARSLSAALAARGITYFFYLQTDGRPASLLGALADDAALVVTDEMPASPFSGWMQRIERYPAWAVDTSCVVPMRLVEKAYDRAFTYREKTRTLYADRLRQGWPSIESARQSALAGQLPFEPIDLGTEDLSALVAECDIDHAVGPVKQTRGGSEAGYFRWETFRPKLQSYSRRRNDPLVDGTSRLSPYLNYGMVSPFRVAREAAEIGGPGAEKFLDELLIWRELAHAFCFHRPDHESLEALPDWARETLWKHQSDPRVVFYDWETLARAQTDDPLWNAAQRSLLVNGELHNNVRMTWGKAILNWTPDPEVALRTMVDLNHRYALDGCNPSSYGGLLWCLGQFDRPFTPERPILGVVRGRSTKEHSARLEPAGYNRHVLPGPARPSVAVVGAGIAGLFCARTLHDHGFPVQVFDKGRGPGGRMSTRRTPEGFRFDHGAQYFTARHPHFQRYVDAWREQGLVAEWKSRVVELTNGKIDDTFSSADSTRRFAGIPGMNAICRHLGGGLDVRYETQVTSAKRKEGCWHLENTNGPGLDRFDVLVVAAPAPQAALLCAEAPILANAAARVRMTGCWALMTAFEETIDVPYDAAFVRENPLSWIARNSSKPSRGGNVDCWVSHGSPIWSEANLELSKDEVTAQLLKAFFAATGARPREPLYAAVHRWRYALPPEPLSERCLFDPQLPIGACGDWCGGPRVEGAFLSGMAMAGRLLAHL